MAVSFVRRRAVPLLLILIFVILVGYVLRSVLSQSLGATNA